jgi:hypothetical protein
MRQHIFTALTVALVLPVLGGDVESRRPAAVPGASTSRDNAARGVVAGTKPEFPAPLIALRQAGHDVNAVETFVRARMPEVHSDLARLHAFQPAAIARIWCELGDGLEAYTALHSKSPQQTKSQLRLLRLETRARLLAMAMAQVRGRQRQGRTNELRGLLAAAFELKLQQAEEQLYSSRPPRPDLRRRIEQRRRTRDQIIEQRLRQLIVEYDPELHW